MAVMCTKETASKSFTTTVLCALNIMNYMDRYMVAGVLQELQTEFNIGDDLTGLLPTIFILSYMLLCPLFGYLGDRYSRRLLICIGIIIWCGSTLMASYMTTYLGFALCRAIFGIGEASYTTIAPTIITDLFVLRTRSIMLGLFHCAVPIGCGIGYILGAEITHMANNWRWSLRVTPIAGVIFIILLIFVKEPKRGESEGKTNMQVTSYLKDLKYLSKNVSFILTVAGSTCISFVMGALAWWAPKIVYIGLNSQKHRTHPIPQNEVAFILGVIVISSGILGVALGPILSQSLINHYPAIDPILCATGLLLSVPLMDTALFIVSHTTAGTYILMFFSQLAMNLNYAIIADITYYVVVPTRRATASAIQIFILHIFGDFSSPYIVGILSEAFKKSLTGSKALGGERKQQQYSFRIHFEGLRYSLFCVNFVAVLGGGFFLAIVPYIVDDREKARVAGEEVGT